jgi:hypothetical protein
MTRTMGSVTLAMVLAGGTASAQTPKPVPPAAPPATAAPTPPPPPPAAPPPPPAAAPAPVTAAAPPAAPAVAPQAAAKPVAPKPAPEMAQLGWLVGSWKCDGKAPAGALGPGTPAYDYKSKMTLKKDLKDFVISAEYEQVKNKVNPFGYRGKGFMSYDGMAKKFVVVGVDSGGNWYSETAEKDGDKLVSEGQGLMGGTKTVIRETFTKVGDKGLSWRGEIKPAGAKDWQTVGEDNCKK